MFRRFLLPSIRFSSQTQLRTFSTGSILGARKVTETLQDDGLLVIEGKPIDTIRRTVKLDDVLTQRDIHSGCSLCRLEDEGLTLRYTDVLVVQQFVAENGHILPQYVTRLCTKQHLKMVDLIRKAKSAKLLGKHNCKPKYKFATFNNHFVTYKPRKMFLCPPPPLPRFHYY